MKLSVQLLAAVSSAVLGAAAGTATAQAPRGAFSLGQNAEAQTCRAQTRLDAGRGRERVDIYCGEWERASGEVVVWPASSEAAALARFAEDCPGVGQTLSSPDFTELRQIPCERASDDGAVRRYGLLARRGDQLILGAAYPADWAPMIAAARVLSGAARAEAVTHSDGLTPGMREIQSVYPAGAPGISASVNQELLRRRAYEQNTSWSFSASERDFAELLRTQERLAPDDAEGAAEILAEIGLNLSGERRFQEAEDSFDEAERRANAAGARLLLTKILNYRAMDRLNQRRPADALELARAANAARDALFGAPSSRAPGIGAADARRIEAMAAPGRRRAVAPPLSGMTDQDRAAILSAQADYLAAAAVRAMGEGDAGRYLNAARDRLATSAIQPAWLTALIYEERSRLAAERGDTGVARREAETGLALLRRAAPGTRAEGHLLMALADARRLGGDSAGALADGRAAVVLFTRHREAPGIAPDVAASHLVALYEEWERTREATAANEYFETLALVWDGAAARSAAQLAARLAAKEGGDAVRAYQDAERVYRAALARRQRLSLSPETLPEKIAEADAAATAAAAALAQAEDGVRASSPRYLELLSPAISAGELVGSLEDWEGYVRMVVSHQGGFGAVVTSAGVTPYRIAIDASQAEALASRLRNSANLSRSGALPDYDIEAAGELYQALLAPAADRIAGLDSLQIDASGPLAAIPFAALVTETPDQAAQDRIREAQDYSGLAWFGRDRTLAASLGPAAFVRTRAATPAAITVPAYAFGDFRPDPAAMARRLAETRGLSDRCREEVQRALARLDALPETAEEARESAAVFGPAAQVRLGETFTDQAVLEDPAVGQAGVLVLATHGVLSLSSCLAEPALLASLGPEGDGLIEASEVLDAGVRARLVVMSACDTAGGGEGDVSRGGFAGGGEALSGLARAFIYAGASSVLATHWKVDATASSLQTRALLTQAAQSKATLAEALSSAQRTLYEDPETAHPFYWSGFVLIGDGAVTLDSGAAAGAGTGTRTAP